MPVIEPMREPEGLADMAPAMRYNAQQCGMVYSAYRELKAAVEARDAN